MNKKCNKLTDEELVALSRKYEERIDEYTEGDPEECHSNADGELCNLLEELGFFEVVKVYEKVHKWYS